MEYAGFLLVIATGIGVIFISIALDFLWAQAIPVRFFYYILRAPGVVVHECAHMLGCLFTGAKIRNVVLFSKEGGSVTYNPPVIPVIGNVVISTAPLFCIPLVLALCTWFFSDYLGCLLPALPLSFDSNDAVIVLGGEILKIFSQNLVVQFNAWFLLYLYLVLSLILSAAPSMQDIRNAGIGICILALTGVLILWSQIPWAVSILTEITRIIGMGFALGLGFGLIALVLSSPLLILTLYRHTA
ncbi:MAG: metalloprotease family protein [Methanoregula sp.]|nr:metalloprotease family protein [Methanoregula sp.]